MNSARWAVCLLLSSGGPAFTGCSSTSSVQPSAADLAAAADASAADGAVLVSSYTVPVIGTSPITTGFRVRISVGGGPAHTVVVDTGSTGIVVPKSALGAAAQLTSEPFSLEYTSSGIIESGHWALAPVRIGVPQGYDPAAPGSYATTVTMRIGVVERVSCDPKISGCTTSGDVEHVGMMGVGFDRDVATSPKTLNPFLQLTEIAAGTLHAGYVISQKPAQIILGLNAEAVRGFQLLPLQPRAGYPGEWDAASVAACVRLPAAPAFGTQCGLPLFDTGIAGGILTTPAALRPVGLATKDPGQLDPGVEVNMNITFPQTAPPVEYNFTVGASRPSTPDYVYLRTSTDGTIHFNTSRHLLALYDYLFDDQGGAIGFRPALQ